MSEAMHITHHFTPGLHFAARWKYAARAPSGRACWSRLPLGQPDAGRADPHGAWWCVRRCAAVLRREMWQSVDLPPGMPLRPGPEDVALALHALMPRWQVQLSAGAGAGHSPLQSCTRALLAGGGAVLQLQSEALHRCPQSTFWAWVIGVEMHQRMLPAPVKPWPSCRAPRPVALLAIPFGWSMPWACGYAARVQVNRDGHCDVDGIDGQWRECRCLAAITLSPAQRGNAGPLTRHAPC